MDDVENRRHQMFVRVRDFGTAHAADFAATSLGGQLFVGLGNIVNQLDGHAATQVSGFGTAGEGTSNRAVSRQALRDTMRAINRTAEAIDHDSPGFADNFRMPRADNDQNLLNAARSFATKAVPVSDQFISHELPANFVANLNSDIADFEAAISRQSTGLGTHVSAGESIDETISEGIVIVKKLDAIVRNRYVDERAVLAEWTSARHTERGPRHTSPAVPPTPTPPSP